MSMSARHTNHLHAETSPYLLQHAHNPVDWYPWGAEALRRATEEDRPILLSIGYAACHWCHVMERESFEDESIAALMNAHFVCVKVDREERPDIDDIYMAATLALNNGQGGWPMTVFLTPDQRPFFAGTYFPPEDRYGRVGFPRLLRLIAERWRTDRAAIEGQAGRLSDLLRAHATATDPLAVVVAEIDAAAELYARQFDATFGGFGPAPKFPPSMGLALLLRHHRRSGDPHALEMVRTTLDAMARGGIHDHVGGGFARYATDERWLVPHFEKMLYDNALLARSYLEAYQVTGQEAYARVAASTLDFVLDEMTSAEGGFHSSLDADSEGEEGKFYVWTPAEIEAILGAEEARRFCAYYDVTPGGNWEGKGIPNTPRPLEAVAETLGIAAADLARSLESGRGRVLEARRRRIPPGRDDKVLTAWNGLMIGAMAEGHRVLGEARYLAAAEGAAAFVLATLRTADGRLLRTYRDGKAHLDAYLEDYAYLADGLVDLYEAGGDARRLADARTLCERLRADFGDDTGGGFYSTARGHETLLFRHRDGKDGATPSPNAVAARALARLSHHFDRPDLRQAARDAVAAYGGAIAQYPILYASALGVVDLLAEGPVELALVGAPGDPRREALRRVMGRRYLPNRIIGYRDPGAPARGGEAIAEPPLVAGKGLVDGEAALYVCRSFACAAPVGDAAAADRLLAAEERSGRESAESLVGTFIAGCASPQATAAYARRFDAAAYDVLGGTGLTVGRVGFGAYRIDHETPEHREALARALGAGINLVDTSTNYTDGGSERLIGAVLAARVGAGGLRREEVVVVSKIGYVQGRNLALAQQREQGGQPFAEMVKYMDGCWHCVHPEFLREQLVRSRARLGLAALDVCLLHNPEYFLSDAKRRGHAGLAAVRDEFYRRLGEAFRFFESEVQAGTLSWYGVSSNSLGAPAADAEATSLTRMLEAAVAAGGPGHHFRVLQLPLNVFEAGGVLERNTGAGGGETVLEVARREGIAVLVNRPLNAVTGAGMTRLADVDLPAAGTSVDVDEQRRLVAGLEDEYRHAIAPLLRSERSGDSPAELFRWAEQLAGIGARVRGLEQWEQIEGQVASRVTHVLRAVDAALAGPPGEQWRTWRERYVPALERLLAGHREAAARQSATAVAAIEAVVDPLLPAERRGEPLARKALWILASTPGVSCVLNGMRRPAYVDDAVAVMRWAPLDRVEPIYAAVGTMSLDRS
jgi:uncharacterized protein YyaL (SSP411 family)/aryl-alcohol dehydrogenase-like predicted oxidoreductase